MKRKLFALLFLLAPCCALAQEEVEHSADRPGMGTGTDIVPKGKVMWEYGMAYDYATEDGESVNAFTFCNSLFRYGLNRVMELRLELDASHLWADGYKTTGLLPVQIGTKIKLYEGEDAVPNVGLLANVALPLASEDFRPTHFAPSLYAMADHDVSDKVNLCYNVGLEWDGESSVPTTFTALCMSYSVTEKWGGYIENYNYFNKYTSPQWNCDLGAWWMVTPRVQLDVAYAFNLNHFKDFANLSFGVAWLIN